MTFDAIPEDKEPSFPCLKLTRIKDRIPITNMMCAGDIVKRDGIWQCNMCDNVLTDGVVE